MKRGVVWLIMDGGRCSCSDDVAIIFLLRPARVRIVLLNAVAPLRDDGNIARANSMMVIADVALRGEGVVVMSIATEDDSCSN